jgi:hypothetical protein
MTHLPARPRTYYVTGRTPGTGPVIAVLTDGPADVAVTAHAADLAARTGTLLITAAAVPTGAGLRVDALLHRARGSRVDADTRAIVARVAPILHSAGVAHFRATLRLPPGLDATRALPVTAVHELVNRFGAVVVVTATPLNDATGVLHAAGPHHDTPDPRPAHATTSPGRPYSSAPW